MTVHYTKKKCDLGHEHYVDKHYTCDAKGCDVRMTEPMFTVVTTAPDYCDEEHACSLEHLRALNPVLDDDYWNVEVEVSDEAIKKYLLLEEPNDN